MLTSLSGHPETMKRRVLNHPPFLKGGRGDLKTFRDYDNTASANGDGPPQETPAQPHPTQVPLPPTLSTRARLRALTFPRVAAQALRALFRKVARELLDPPAPRPQRPGGGRSLFAVFGFHRPGWPKL